MPLKPIWNSRFESTWWGSPAESTFSVQEMYARMRRCSSVCLPRVEIEVEPAGFFRKACCMEFAVYSVARDTQTRGLDGPLHYLPQNEVLNYDHKVLLHHACVYVPTWCAVVQRLHGAVRTA